MSDIDEVASDVESERAPEPGDDRNPLETVPDDCLRNQETWLRFPTGFLYKNTQSLMAALTTVCLS